MSLRQTKKWWRMLEINWQVENIYEIDGVYVEKRSLWFWEYGFFVIWIDKKQLNSKLEKKLITLCREEIALFIQIETINYLDFSETISMSGSLFEEGYYKKFITSNTALIDLSKSKEDILADMKQKGRYNIKLAEKNGVKVKVVEKTDGNIEAFYELILQTTKRDSFNWHSKDYYTKFLNTLDNSELILAYKDNDVIAWWIFIFNKDASIYYYWASTDIEEYRKLMAPYLVQWKAIKEAKKRSSKLYDFLWVVWDDWEDSHLAWVTDFKKKFTKDIRQVSEGFIWVNKRWKYKFIQFIRKNFKK